LKILLLSAATTLLSLNALAQTVTPRPDLTYAQELQQREFERSERLGKAYGSSYYCSMRAKFGGDPVILSADQLLAYAQADAKRVGLFGDFSFEKGWALGFIG
jgi:hypothetical protein